MEATGKAVEVTRDWQTGKLRLTFEINEDIATETLNDITACEKLSIKAAKYREKRSLDANRTLWLCIGRIAATLRADKWEIYLQMLRRYGKFTYICVKGNVVEAVQMLCYFGSSTLNTQEFSVLLDGIISEMKEMDLGTPTSEETRAALEQWDKNYGK